MKKIGLSHGRGSAFYVNTCNECLINRKKYANKQQQSNKVKEQSLAETFEWCNSILNVAAKS